MHLAIYNRYEVMERYYIISYRNEYFSGSCCLSSGCFQSTFPVTMIMQGCRLDVYSTFFFPSSVIEPQVAGKVIYTSIDAVVIMKTPFYVIVWCAFVLTKSILLPLTTLPIHIIII